MHFNEHNRCVTEENKNYNNATEVGWSSYHLVLLNVTRLYFVCKIVVEAATAATLFIYIN